MHRGFIVISIILAAVSVMLGAFGAHGLRQIADKETIESFKTGVQYQFYHVFALFITAILYGYYNKRLITFAGFFFLAGILFFSGSLYAITFVKTSECPVPTLFVYVTPAGGVFFITGWILLLLALFKK